MRQTWPTDLPHATRVDLLEGIRRLAAGTPITVPDPAADGGLPVDLASGWIERDEAGRIVGLAGLCLAPTPHRLQVGATTVHAWCAWDTLFLPELLGATVAVASTCPVTGEAVALTLVGSEIRATSSPRLRLAFTTPSAREFRAGPRRVFCRHVHFLRDADAAATWTAERPGVFAIDLALGLRLALLRNTVVFGALLGERAIASRA
ncbi:MAG: hypothetical protein H6983_04840 [Ectothiorhodospiraceae bacterium]|nr:hypothetical protein [Ectothiorhodospiraceae bacterium]